MKIAIDITASIYEGTGVATYYNNLIPAMLERNTKHRFILFGYSLRRRKELKFATKTFPFPPRLMELIWNKYHIWSVESLIGDCDVYHSWDYIQPPTKKAKIVTTIHDLTPLKFPEYQHPRTIAAYKQGLKWVKKEASAVITDSLSTKKDIIEMLKIPEDKIYVIYLAVPDEFHQFRERFDELGKTSIARIKQAYGIEGDYLLYVGTQEPRKNLERVIKAFELIKSDTTLVIAGNFGWGKKMQSTKGVKAIGYVDKQDLPALYAGASCFIYPSLYEGFGLPVLEAMAVGCPVVTSYKGSLAEIADDAAVLVNPEKVDAIAFGIEAALNNRKTLIINGLDRVKKFSWDKSARETMEVYERVVRK